ncbi:MAG TPA: cation transporter [Dokdonella sp.]|uniref:heavy-metal-associated domain-containing protein n=1 Tax=Dokdonella sp. TaxID=2291710 RepID=UPI002C68E99A|nr:cation transporter [Dokdonella sp.]HOX70830.1 cation transporter [Dokdonella sp.]HPG94509.1 cation transporter [Dokdonella sp.]HPN78479.1 cation transporter [Dokdonella sp.]
MRLDVQGMTCAHCARAIQQALAALGGTAEVDVAGGTVEVTGIDDAATVRQAIEAEGYTVVSNPVATTPSGCCGARR